MDKFTELADRYIAVWNEADGSRRRELIARTWTEDARYLDPLMQGEGHAGIDGLVQGVQAQFPGHTFRRTGEVDAHHDHLRFTWELGPESAPPLVRGLDFGVNQEGRLSRDTGFLYKLPTLPSGARGGAG